MGLDDLIDTIKNNANNEVGHFLLTIDGLIIASNNYGARLLKYKTLAHIEGIHLSDLVPREFAENLPPQITHDHLTNGQFLARVNLCADNSHIPTLVKTQYIKLDQGIFVECFIKENTQDNAPLGEQRYRQAADLLMCEVKRLKRTALGNDKVKSINQDLVDALLARHQNMTQNDYLFCSLIVAGLPTKEIADIMCITVQSAYKLRKRLRKKLNLSTDINFFNYLCGLLCK